MAFLEASVERPSVAVVGRTRAVQGGPMLSIGKLAVGQERYYEKQVAEGLDDYFTGRGESPGRWLGRGAAALGLGGVVQDGELSLLTARCLGACGIAPAVVLDGKVVGHQNPDSLLRELKGRLPDGTLGTA